MRVFPRDIAKIIADYYAELKILDWIDPDYIEYTYADILYANTNALKAGMLDLSNPRELYKQEGEYCEYFGRNPAAGDILEKSTNLEFCIDSMWSNPAVFDWLMKQNVRIDHGWLARNPNPRAIAHLIANLSKLNDEDRDLLSTNPGMMSWLLKDPKRISRSHICANPAAIDIIRDMSHDEIDYQWLSDNPHPWAIEQLSKNRNLIDWESFMMNPGIFELRADDELLRTLLEL